MLNCKGAFEVHVYDEGFGRTRLRMYLSLGGIRLTALEIKGTSWMTLWGYTKVLDEHRSVVRAS